MNRTKQAFYTCVDIFKYGAKNVWIYLNDVIIELKCVDIDMENSCFI